MYIASVDCRLTVDFITKRCVIMKNSGVIDKLHDIVGKCGDLDPKKIDKIRDAIEEDDDNETSTLKVILTVVLAIAAGIAVAYFIYRYFRPDYLDSFNDDFDDDFEDDFFEDDDDAEDDGSKD